MPALQSISGLISGLQTDDIIQKLIDFKKRPIQLLNNQKTQLTDKLAAWQSLNARLLAVKLRAADLTTASTFGSKSAVSSDESVATVSASSAATQGSYTLKVLSLAKAQQLGSAQNYESPTNSSVGNGTITIHNTSSNQAWSITIPEGADSLEAVRDAINASGSDAIANIVSDGSASPYRLVLTSRKTGSAGALSVTTSLTGGAGLSFDGPSSVISPADDAQVQLGSGATPIVVTSSSNTITTLIPGVTLTLNSAAPDRSISVNVGSDTQGITKKIQDFVSAYNDYVSFARDAARYDPETQQSGPLIGDFTLQTLQSNISGHLNRGVSGLSGAVAALSSLGVRLTQDGTLSIDSATLQEQLSTNLAQASRVMARSGAATDAGIVFLNATGATRESTGAGYSIDITQVATQARVTAGVAMSAPLAQEETLTINGAQVTLSAGSDLATVVSAINAISSRTGVTVAATQADGSGTGSYLTFRSNSYGSSVHVSILSTVSSGVAGSSGVGNVQATDTSAQGENGTGTGAAGVDVAGLINGELATGNGKILTSASSNPTTGGLSVLVNSTTTGSKGFVTYSRGVAAAINDVLASLTDISTGAVTTTQKGLQDQITSLDDQMASLNTRLSQEEERIRTQFAALESTLSTIQSQGQYLSAQFAALSGQKK
ncbi:MAG: flagellar filament capping protein FliD [Armatimonadetes bacterium]|nr:flagellar filament capping protein FliD [Armatimonadota bacterium]